MLPLIPLAISLAPTIAKWLFGDDTAKVVEQVGSVVSAVTGVVDPSTPEGVAAVQAAISNKPELVMRLQAELARIAADREVSARKADLDDLTARFADTASARAQTASLAASGSAIAYGAPVVSALVLATFAVVMALAFTRALPPGSETTLTMLLGTLAAMATSVVSYWVGSSAGSARKDAALAESAKGGRP